MTDTSSATDVVITKTWLKKVLHDEFGHDQFTIDSFTFGSGVGKGENYSSVTLRIVATVEAEGQLSTHRLFAKFMPPSEEARRVLEQMGTFTKEAFVYKTLIPEFLKYSREHTGEMETLAFPKLICVSQGGPDELGSIVLADLKPLNFQMFDKMKGMDVAHCKMVVQELAKFHAIGLAMKKNGNLTLFDEIAAIDKESKFAETFVQYFLQPLRGCCVVSKACAEVADIVPRLENFVERSPEIITNVFHRIGDGKLDTIVHGDSWNNNLMFKYDDSGNPSEVMLLDLQVVHIGSLARDLVYFIYTSTTEDFRKSHLKEVLRHYQSVLVDRLTKYGLDQDDPDFSDAAIYREYQDNLPFGFVIGLGAAHHFSMDTEELANLQDGLTTEKYEEFMKEKAKEAEAGILSNFTKQRVTSVVKEMDRMRVI